MFNNAHFIVRCLRYRFHTESLQLKTLMALNLRGATVIDIGANKGIYSFWMSRTVGPAGRVLAFEPQPEMINYIEDKKARFGLSNITTFNFGLSNDKGTGMLLRQRVGDGSASLQPDRARDDSEAIKVEVGRLDDLEGLSNVAFIKCDVEGHEIDVFSGGRNLIDRFKPIVQFEATAREARELFDLFHHLRYSGVMLLDGEYRPLSDLERAPSRKFGFDGHRDFLFFPQQAVGTTIPAKLRDRLPV